MSYDIEIQSAVEKQILDVGDIFDFRDTPNEQLFAEFYQFCRENLEIQYGLHDIEPAIFIYNNFFDSNAMASYGNDIFSITINLGLIGKCKANFLDNDQLENYTKQKFGCVIEKYDVSVSTLAFQIATQFTYYHELAHLIQFAKRRTQQELQEHYPTASNYNELKHLLEINADSFASIALAGHFQQFMQKSFGNEISQESTEATITILSACLLNHIANFCDDLPNIYYREHSHPHPFLRLFAVMLNIVNYLNQSPYLEERGISIPINQIFKKVLDFYEELEGNGVFETAFKNAMEEASNQQAQIVEYLGDLIEFNLVDYNDAVEEWNKHT